MIQSFPCFAQTYCFQESNKVILFEKIVSSAQDSYYKKCLRKGHDLSNFSHVLYKKIVFKIQTK